MKLKFIASLLFAVLVVLFFTSTRLDPNNPPTGKTGAPGEQTCQAGGCHSGGSFTGTVEISGLPDTVVADQTYSITLTNTSNATRAGFEITVLDGTNSKAGTLMAGSGCSMSNSGGRQYVRQSSPKNLSGGSASWTFNWKAPTTVDGESIHFYFVSLCANGNGNKTGDNVLVNSKTVLLPQPVSTVREQEEAFSAAIYPNPTSDYFTVELPDRGTITLFDANGRKVYESALEKAAVLDVSRLPEGLYMAKMECDGKQKTQALVINRK